MTILDLFPRGFWISLYQFSFCIDVVCHTNLASRHRHGRQTAWQGQLPLIQDRSWDQHKSDDKLYNWCVRKAYTCL